MTLRAAALKRTAYSLSFTLFVILYKTQKQNVYNKNKKYTQQLDKFFFQSEN